MQKLAYEDIPPDLWSLGALMCSFVGMSFKWKGLTWVGFAFAVAALCNKRTHDADTKQIITGSVFAFSALLIGAITRGKARKPGRSSPATNCRSERTRVATNGIR